LSESWPTSDRLLTGESQPGGLSVHGAIAEHYKVDPAKLTESHASTIDYVIARLPVECLAHSEARWRRVTSCEQRELVGSDRRGGTEEGVLVVRRIHVAMRLVAPEQVRETWRECTASMPCAVP